MEGRGAESQGLGSRAGSGLLDPGSGPLLSGVSNSSLPSGSRQEPELEGAQEGEGPVQRLGGGSEPTLYP